MLKEKIIAPDFVLPDQTGEKHLLSDYRGCWVLLYFYPKDETRGCTIEACAFRDLQDRFKELNLVVLGVSKDSVASHRQFSANHQLNFAILADEEGMVIKEYEADGLETKRISYLIDTEGIICKTYARVVPELHAEQVRKDVQNFLEVFCLPFSEWAE